MKMKGVLNIAVMFPLGFAALAFSATPAVDPLTKLPLYSSADTVMNVPASQMCKSKMQSDFYSVNSGKFSAVVAWYDSHLSGFHKTHAYGVDRFQDTFDAADGTVIVSITAEPGKNGEDTNANSVVYARLQPGLTEKEIVGMNAGHLVCN
jgi:hypothetical protein